MKYPILIFFLLAQAFLSAGPVILPEQRRVAIIEGLASVLSYERPDAEQLALIPDPFTFGRVLAGEEEEEEEPEAFVEGLTNEELMRALAGSLRDAVIGYQEVGDRAFLATRTFGLLRTGDTIEMAVPGRSGSSVSVQILDLEKTGLTLRLEDIETYVPLDSNRSGITTSQP